MLSVDTFIAIKYAVKYKVIVTHHRVYICIYIVITIIWAITLLVHLKITRLMYEMMAGTEYGKSQFGT